MTAQRVKNALARNWHRLYYQWSDEDGGEISHEENCAVEKDIEWDVCGTCGDIRNFCTPPEIEHHCDCGSPDAYCCAECEEKKERRA